MNWYSSSVERLASTVKCRVLEFSFSLINYSYACIRGFGCDKICSVLDSWDRNVALWVWQKRLTLGIEGLFHIVSRRRVLAAGRTFADSFGLIGAPMRLVAPEETGNGRFRFCGMLLRKRPKVAMPPVTQCSCPENMQTLNKNRISCSVRSPSTIHTVQSLIAKDYKSDFILILWSISFSGAVAPVRRGFLLIVV